MKLSALWRLLHATVVYDWTNDQAGSWGAVHLPTTNGWQPYQLAPGDRIVVLVVRKRDA